MIELLDGLEKKINPYNSQSHTKFNYIIEYYHRNAILFSNDWRAIEDCLIVFCKV